MADMRIHRRPHLSTRDNGFHDDISAQTAACLNRDLSRCEQKQQQPSTITQNESDLTINQQSLTPTLYSLFQSESSPATKILNFQPDHKKLSIAFPVNRLFQGIPNTATLLEKIPNSKDHNVPMPEQHLSPSLQLSVSSQKDKDDYQGQGLSNKTVTDDEKQTQGILNLLNPRLSSVIWVVLIFGLMVAVVRLQSRLDHLEAAFEKLAERTQNLYQKSQYADQVVTQKPPNTYTSYKQRKYPISDVANRNTISSELKKGESSENHFSEDKNDVINQPVDNSGDTQKELRKKRSSEKERKENVKELNPEEMKKYCFKRICPKAKSSISLPTEQFFGHFYHVYDYKTDFTNKSRDCFIDTNLPTKPQVCKEANIKYNEQESELAFYRPIREVNKNSKQKLPLLELFNQTTGEFRVDVAGMYYLHANITIVDESNNHSLALFLNDFAVLACPKGGFRCPRTNEENSFKYRICNINGMLELSRNDRLQFRTLQRDTVVRLENHRKSHFKVVLLHRTSNRHGKKHQ